MSHKLKNKLNLGRLNIQASLLLNSLRTSPVNKTQNSGVDILKLDYNCHVFANALKIALIRLQDTHSIYENLIEHANTQDMDSMNKNELFSPEKIKAYLHVMQCSRNSVTNSIYSYWKYMTMALSSLIGDRPNSNSNGQTLNVNDVIQMFYPYIEGKAKHKQVLHSSTYLGLFLKNKESFFPDEKSIFCNVSKAKDGNIKNDQNNNSKSTQPPNNNEDQQNEEESQIEDPSPPPPS
jgi:hypothetical protein